MKWGPGDQSSGSCLEDILLLLHLYCISGNTKRHDSCNLQPAILHASLHAAKHQKRHHLNLPLDVHSFCNTLNKVYVKQNILLYKHSRKKSVVSSKLLTNPVAQLIDSSSHFSPINNVHESFSSSP